MGPSLLIVLAPVTHPFHSGSHVSDTEFINPQGSPSSWSPLSSQTLNSLGTDAKPVSSKKILLCMWSLKQTQLGPVCV